MKNTRQINSATFAEPMGAYSHGYVVNLGQAEMIFTTGQIALDNQGNVVHPDNVEKQIEVIAVKAK